MAMTEKVLYQLKNMVKEDMDTIRAAGISVEPLGTLMFWATNGKLFKIVAVGESMYDRFEGLPVQGRGYISSLRRFVMTACNTIFQRKTRDCGFSSHGIRYTDNSTTIVTWEELCAEFCWGKNPEFVYRIERIHK